MPNISAGVRITGVKNAQGEIVQFSDKALQNIRKAADKRGKVAVNRFKSAMADEYTSKWATGALAAGIKVATEVRDNGVDVRFTITDKDELKYVTALLGGYFQQFPVGPFEIRPVVGKTLFVPFPGRARQFIRGKGGRFAGSKAGAGIRTKRVLWGSKTGGFSRDVLTEVGQAEGAAFIQDMQAAVADAVVQTKS